jgi:3-deoxy-D-manno-octulosonic-acid transferase
MIYIYKILGFVLIPIIKINVYLRINYNKEMKSRYKERYGNSNYRFNNDKKIIWIHAASLGEFKSSDYFIQKYYQNYNLLITTTTVSAAEYAIKNYGKKIIHQFAPLDVSVWINKFLNKWNPNFIIWIESDLWPATLHSIKKRKIDAVLVNLRLSPKSLKRWELLPSFYNSLLDCFGEIFVQSKLDQQRIAKISKREIKFVGNLKLTPASSNLQKKQLNNVKRKLNTKYLMLASTHLGEESILLPVIKNLLEEFNDLHIIIAPRHPERSSEIFDLYSSYNLKSQILSKKKDKEDKDTDNKILIIDSFGILPKYFAISDIVFLGGSLIPAGGHNPIEPALYNCAILTGSYIFNWQNIFDDMVEKKGCLKLDSIESLKISLKKLLNNENKIFDMQINSLKFSQKKFIDTMSLDNTINNYLDIC